MAGEYPHVYRYRVDRRYLPALLLSGFWPGRDAVRIDEGTLTATFGFVKLSTDRSNVTGAHITRDYRWWTAVGSRMSFVDDGLTFGTNHEAGVCIHFSQPVPSLMRRSGHSALTVTVADLEGLVRELGSEEPA